MTAGGGSGSVSEGPPRGERPNSPSFYKSWLVPKHWSPSQHLPLIIALSFSKPFFVALALSPLVSLWNLAISVDFWLEDVMTSQMVLTDQPLHS